MMVLMTMLSYFVQSKFSRQSQSKVFTGYVTVQQTESLSNQTVHNSHGSISYNSHSFVRDMFDTILVTIPFLAPVVIS